MHFDAYLREFDASLQLLVEASKAEAQRSMPASSAAPAPVVATQRPERWRWRCILHFVSHVGRAPNYHVAQACIV